MLILSHRLVIDNKLFVKYNLIMKILLIADVHNRLDVNKVRHTRTLKSLKRVISRTSCDLLVFLGDTVHGPDFKGREALYERALREVLDITQGTPFAAVFGNHDDECGITKEEILRIQQSYPNCLTRGRDYVLDMGGEALLFIDSGTYYDGEESFYDTVKPEQIAFALSEIREKKAILFQHIIVPDILPLTHTKKRLFLKKTVFKSGVLFDGRIGERPCPPDVNTGEWEQLSPYLKAAVFGHDHKNDFELTLDGVRMIQCAGAGRNCYEYPQIPRVKLLDTETLKTETVYLC